MSEYVSGVRWGIVLCIVTILFSFILGAWMGMDENFFKGNFKQGVQANASKLFNNDKAKMDRALDRAWTYVKRSHMHAAGLGVAGLLIVILIPLVISSKLWQMLLSVGMGLGSIGYPLCWLIAGYRVPWSPSTDVAKASVDWLVYPSAGLMLAVTAITLVLLLRQCFAGKDTSSTLSAR